MNIHRCISRSLTNQICQGGLPADSTAKPSWQACIAKETLLLGLSEKLNTRQNELTISLSKSKKLSAQVERLELNSKDYKGKVDIFEKENVELKKDNVEIVSYCESLKKELQSLELSNEDLFSNQKELEVYITKLRKKAGRDEIKVKELEGALEQEKLTLTTDRGEVL